MSLPPCTRCTRCIPWTGELIEGRTLNSLGRSYRSAYPSRAMILCRCCCVLAGLLADPSHEGETCLETTTLPNCRFSAVIASFQITWAGFTTSASVARGQNVQTCTDTPEEMRMQITLQVIRSLYRNTFNTLHSNQHCHAFSRAYATWPTESKSDDPVPRCVPLVSLSARLVSPKSGQGPRFHS